MAQEKLGIIAGIGDALTGVNVISPQFDARIRKFIVGDNAILDGLEIEEYSGAKYLLTTGICIAEGYTGELKENIEIPPNATHIYGEFIVKHNPELTDEFDIVFADGELNAVEHNADILHEAGAYYLLLYKRENSSSKFIKQLNNLYPKFSHETDNVVDGGTLGEFVTGVTADVNDTSQKCATTEFVHNRVQKEIEDTMFNDNVPFYYLDREVGILYFKKTLNNVVVIAQGRLSQLSSDAMSAVGISFTVPDSFLPKGDNALIGIPYISFDNSGNTYYWRACIALFKVNRNGDATLISAQNDNSIYEKSGGVGSRPDSVAAYFEEYYESGYQI